VSALVITHHSEVSERTNTRLADACDRTWPGPHDIEWAVAADALFLLQRRPITVLG
jgi:hypothetical protein